MKLICWDLDGTMGEFSALESHLGSFWVRQGIPEIIKFCHEEHNAIQVLTTNATKPYAEEALRRSGLASYFSNIYDQSSVMSWQGKKYRDVQREYPKADFLIIGDRIQDKPLDLNAVFIWDITAPEKPAVVLKILVKRFLAAKSYRKEAKIIYKEAAKEEEVKVFSLTPEERCVMMYAKYKGLNRKMLKVPFIAIESVVKKES